MHKTPQTMDKKKTESKKNKSAQKTSAVKCGGEDLMGFKGIKKKHAVF